MNDDRPAACPRCGSTDPAEDYPAGRPDLWTDGVNPMLGCTDDWHDRPTDDLPMRKCSECGMGWVVDDRPTDDWPDVRGGAATTVKDAALGACEQEVGRLTALGNALADAARFYRAETTTGPSALTAAIDAWENR